MNFNLNKSLEILDRTPSVLSGLLTNLSDDWIFSNEGESTWSPFDVVGHLIHCEKTDWIPRMKIILEHGTNKTFEPFDRFAQMRTNKDKSMNSLLHDFSQLRTQNVEVLRTSSIDKVMLNKKGRHPELGEVTLQELLAAWTSHDLGHIVQISRVMAKQLKSEVGPWIKYLTVLRK